MTEDFSFASKAGEGIEPATPAEPQATDSHSQTYEDRLSELERELERPYSPDFMEGFKAAAEQVGAEIELEPGQEGYVEWAQAEIENLRQQYDQTLGAMGAVVQQAEQDGNFELAEFARGLVEQVNAQRELAEFEQQARAEEAALRDAAALATGDANISNWITETADLVGADAGWVEPDRVAEIANDAYARLVEQHGQEVANAMVPQLIQRTVEHVANEHEAGMQNAFEAAKKLSHAFGGKADPTEVVRIAGEVFPRALYKAGGDVTEASRESLMAATKTAAGFSERSQPEKMNLAELYASLNDAVPRAVERPEMRAQERDSKGRFITGTPVAQKYAAPEPKSEAELRADAEKEAIKRAFSALNINR